MLSAQPGPRTRDERGFTLIETLMALVTGVVVAGALFAVLEVSLHQTAVITNNVQATRQGRTAMTKIVDELHSACLGPGFAPVQSPSNATELRFVNAYSNRAVIPNAAEKPAEGAYERVIKYEPAGAKGKLVEESRPSVSSSTWPNFKFTQTGATTRVIGEAISPTSGTPIFQYYKYGTESSQTPNESITTLESASAGSEETAATVAGVRVSFTTSPADTKFQAPLSSSRVAGESVALSSQVTFALGSPNAENPVAAAPCQ